MTSEAGFGQSGERCHPEDVSGPGQRSIPITFAGLCVVLDHSGAAYLSGHGALVVSDLHLEKGSSAAARGRLVPPHDSHDTLLRLRYAIEAYRPERVICLGDSFHDRRAEERIAGPDRDMLSSLCALVGEWVWIGGNHDPEAPAFCEGARRGEVTIGGVILRHEPRAEGNEPQIAGHFHPKASISADAFRFSGRCFCVSSDLLVMPAFGAYAGGLAWTAPALRSLHRTEPSIYMLHSSKIWPLR